jgi:hypothetical protein
MIDDARNHECENYISSDHLQLYDPNCLPNVIQVIKSRRMRWAEHVACMGRQERYIQGFGGET